jgi:hypothetical protein
MSIIIDAIIQGGQNVIFFADSFKWLGVELSRKLYGWDSFK